MNVINIKKADMKKILSILIFCFGLLTISVAQDSAEAVIKEAPVQKFTRATFNATKLINMQTTEITSPGAMQFMISHHFSYFWNKDEGGQNFAQLFGLNSGFANTYLSFDYSPIKWMNLGIAASGHSSYEGWAKFKLMRQQTGAKNYPVSIALFSLARGEYSDNIEYDYSSDRYSFMNQLLIARKFSDKLSLEFTPAWIHFNVVPYGINNSNDVFSLGFGGKYKMTSKLNFTLEYARQLNMYENIITKNGTIVNFCPDLLSAGIEINTGGHLFQFYISNTIESSNINQLARNTSFIKDGQFALGFTINRNMNVKKEKD